MWTSPLKLLGHMFSSLLVSSASAVITSNNEMLHLNGNGRLSHSDVNMNWRHVLDRPIRLVIGVKKRNWTTATQPLKLYKINNNY